MADEPRYKNARDHGMGWGTIIPNADYTKGLEHSGVEFEVHKAVPHNIVVCDVKGNTSSSIPITAEQLEKLKTANRTPDGFKNANCLTYEDVMKPEEKTAAPVAAPSPPPAPPPAPVPVAQAAPPVPVVINVPPESQSVSSSAQSVLPYKGPPIPLDSILPEPAQSSNKRAKAQKPGHERVQFSGPFGKLTVLYNEVFRYDIYLVLRQVREDGLFYEAPAGQEIIEVRWNNCIFGCLSGPHIVMPDQKTALTILLIDGAYSREVGPADGQGRQP